MSWRKACLTACVVCVGLGGNARVAALDLAAARTPPAKEPAYRSARPEYALLVFGPKAAFRVWLVLDGEILYADRNGDGDLTGADERIARGGGLTGFRVGSVTEPGGKARHSGLAVTRHKDGSMGVLVSVGGERIQMAGYDDRGVLRFGTSPATAPVVHFGGALTLGLLRRVSLKAGKEVTLDAAIGTPGHGPGSFAALKYYGIPKEVHPVAELTPAGGGPRLTVPLRTRY